MIFLTVGEWLINAGKSALGFILGIMLVGGLLALFWDVFKAGWRAFGPEPTPKKKTPEEQAAEPTSDELISNIENLMEQLKQKQAEEKAKDQNTPQ